MAGRKRKRKTPVSVDDLGLEAGTRNMLRRHHINLVSELVKVPPTELKRLPGMGPKTIGQIVARLEHFGLKLLYRDTVHRIQVEAGLTKL